MRDIEELRAIAVSMGKTLDKLLYEMLSDVMEELDQHKNNWEELKKWLEEQHQFIIEIPAFTKEIIQEHKTMELCYEDILNKMKELEEDK